MKIKKGDKIKIVTGKDRGREGTVERVYPLQNKILVAGVNIFKKHVKKSEKMPQGGIVEISRPLQIANVALVCPQCGKPTRIGYKIEENRKVRICRKCKKAL